MKSFLIVGMGSFGHHLCRALVEQKCEVKLDKADAAFYNNNERATAYQRFSPANSLGLHNRNRHRAGWRFPLLRLLITIVTVKSFT